MSRPPFPLDQALVRRRAGRAAEGFDRASALDREVSRRMGERLDYIRLEPKTVLDLGCGTGGDLNFLQERYPKAARIACDFSLPMLKKAEARSGWFSRLFSGTSRPRLVCGDANALPLASGSVSLAWSNLLFQWLPEPLPAFKEVQRALEVGGLFMFSTLGPDTLRELRQALGDAAVHRFSDMHDIGDMLVQAGFSDPVMDMDMLALTYEDAGDLFQDLRLRGAMNAAQGRSRGLLGKSAWSAARQRLEAGRRDGLLSVTIEVVYGHAWKPRPKTTTDGRAIVHFDPGQKRSP